MSSEDTYVEYVLDGVRPTCACGCGKSTRYRGLTVGFMKFRQGHHVVLNNPWGHNPQALKKSAETMRRLSSEGLLTVWNKGLTIEDERVAAYGRKISETILSDPLNIERRSQRMREHRLSGVVPTLTGSAHSQWKGGTSTLQPLCRARLHQRWVYPRLLAANFTCQGCGVGSEAKLCVHHDQERFATILGKAIAKFGEPGNDHSRKDEIAEWIVGYHLEHNVSGVVLCFECHQKAHQGDV